MVGPPGLLVESCLHSRLVVFAYPTKEVVQTLYAYKLSKNLLFLITKESVYKRV